MSELFYIDRKFNDFDDFAATARLWNVQMNQLSRGKSINTLKQLSLEKTKLTHCIFNGHKTTVGDPPLGRTFAFYSGVKSELIWRKKKVQQNNIMIFPSGAEHDVMTKGKNIHVYTITLPETVWSSFLSDREANDYQNQLSSQEIVSLSAHDMSQLKQLFLSYFKIIETNPKILDQKSFQRRVEEQIIYAITRALSLSTSYFSQSKNKKTHNAWDKIDVIIQKHSDSLLTVYELSLAVEVSERSLRRLFHDRYGISPKYFLNRTRLNRVRSDLKKCCEEKNNIADIANNHGFWHMGQFAADYKKLFGELPSTTLKAC